MQSASSNAVAQKLNDYLTVIESNAQSVTVSANGTSTPQPTWNVPNGYKSLALVGWDISGASGAVNLYATVKNNFLGKTGTQNPQVWVRNYTGTQYTVTVKVFVLCMKI